jgi:DNA polymerase
MQNKLSKTDGGLLKVKKDVIACQKCPLYKTRTLPVIGQGSHVAEIMFIGEAPGKNEDLQGRPFCGRSGEVLSELLETINLKREDVYICNILKCRPPENRNPMPNEIDACTDYLDRQIVLINPRVICCLGNFATRYVLEKFGLADKVQGISKIRGQIFKAGKRKIIPLYHPAVAVYDANQKTTLIEDLKIVKKAIGENNRKTLTKNINKIRLE